MSILISGMEMPTSCWNCYFQDCGNCRLNDHKVVDKCIIEDRRDEDCPLVPVPDHGRMIDADALGADIWKMRARYQMLDDTQTADKIMHGLYRAEQAVKDAPTIIPADPPRGGE